MPLPPSKLTPDMHPEFRRLWVLGTGVAEIAAILGVTKNIVCSAARRMNPPPRRQGSAGSPVTGDHARKPQTAPHHAVASPQAPRVAAAPLVLKPRAIPRRELFRLASEFGVARSRAGDIVALNAAVQRAEPGHPGYRLTSAVPWLVGE